MENSIPVSPYVRVEGHASTPSSSSTSKWIHRRIGNRVLWRYLYPCSEWHYSQLPKYGSNICSSIDGWVDTLECCKSYKKRILEMQPSMAEHCGHDVEWNKPAIKETSTVSFHMGATWNSQYHWHIRYKRDYQGLGGAVEHWCLVDIRLCFDEMKTALGIKSVLCASHWRASQGLSSFRSPQANSSVV